jgi:hypothetical protein
MREERKEEKPHGATRCGTVNSGPAERHRTLKAAAMPACPVSSLHSRWVPLYQVRHLHWAPEASCCMVTVQDCSQAGANLEFCE